MDISLLPGPGCWLILSSALLLLGTAVAQNHPKPKPTQGQGFEIIGISARTNNAKEMAGDGAIPQLWKRLYSPSDTFFDRIPAKIDNSVYAAYTDYASDATGDYTFVLGARVKPGTRPLEGMVAIQVPPGRYLQFTTGQGSLPEVVPKLWREIYAYFGQHGVPQRALKADYEVYDVGMDPTNGTATIFIGVE